MEAQTTLPDLGLVHLVSRCCNSSHIHRAANACAFSGRFQFGLQVQVGDKLNKIGQDVRESVHLQLQGSEVRWLIPPMSSSDATDGINVTKLVRPIYRCLYFAAHASRCAEWNAIRLYTIVRVSSMCMQPLHIPPTAPYFITI